ncbi:hypothetical protein Tco_0671241 [Tanacetum coccineum]
MSSPYLIVNKVGSIVPLVKPLDIRNVESSSYQALGACFNPYRVFLRRKRIFKKRSKKKAKNKQIQARDGKDQVKSKSKVIKMKILQLEGLKLPKPKVGTKLPTPPKKSSFPPQNPVTTVSSMAKIDSKEAQMKSKAGIFALDYTSHKQAHVVYALPKNNKLQVPELG